MVQPYHSCLISDTGKGVLYTSDADGIVFSESLRDHVVSLRRFFVEVDHKQLSYT